MQQRRRARAHHLAQIILRRGFEKELVIGGLPLTVGVEPVPLARHMVQHQIGHQREIGGDAVYIRPIAKLRVHRAKIGHRKPVVRGIGKERQDMHTVQCAAQVAMQEVVQQIQRLMRPVHDRVAIGDQQRVTFRPKRIAGNPASFAAGCPLGPEGIKDHASQDVGIQIGIDLCQHRAEPRAERTGTVRHDVLPCLNILSQNPNAGARV